MHAFCRSHDCAVWSGLSQQQELTFSVLVSKLERLDQAEGLVHRTSHRQIVDGNLPQDALIINHKQPPVCRKKKRKKNKSEAWVMYGIHKI